MSNRPIALIVDCPSQGVRRLCVVTAVLLGTIASAPIWAGSPPADEVRRLIAEQDDACEPRGWKYIVLHHSATDSGSVESIDAAHRQRRDSNGQPWRGIGYHFVIGNGNGMADGEVAATFRWHQQTDGAHAGVAQFNQLGIGICLIGNFEEAAPTPAQVASAARLINALQAEYRIEDDRLLAHRDLKPTACPGERFPLAMFREEKPVILQTSQTGD
ncbi:MAG: N-acetylmuramoyl-L-alanine amidase [Planctomycetaceae bacterium]|nr:N-acetylmuramoyl-L-alanine amidase [Planctomycetaceae bacterium]